ncbi:MAG: hypothetical protein ACREEE_00915, partial [Dongiaceae bacterium]
MAVKRRRVLARYTAGRLAVASTAAIVLLTGLALFDVSFFLALRPLIGDLGAVFLIAVGHTLVGALLVMLALREPASAELAALTEAETKALSLVSADAGDIVADIAGAQRRIEQIGQYLLPENFHRNLIRLMGENLRHLTSYLSASFEPPAREQAHLGKQVTEIHGSAEKYGQLGEPPFPRTSIGIVALEAMQEQTRLNIALVEKAISIWWPLT